MSPLSSRPIRVLLVEDDVALRAIMRRWLVRGGFRVVDASSGAEALAFFVDLPRVDVVITDTSMKGVLSGVELIRRIRALRASQVIIRTSGREQDDFDGAPLPDDISFVAKPFHMPDLVQRARSSLEPRSRGPHLAHEG